MRGLKLEAAIQLIAEERLTARELARRLDVVCREPAETDRRLTVQRSAALFRALAAAAGSTMTNPSEAGA